MEKDNSLKNRIKELQESYKRVNSKNNTPLILPKKRVIPSEQQIIFSEQNQSHYKDNQIDESFLSKNINTRENKDILEDNVKNKISREYYIRPTKNNEHRKDNFNSINNPEIPNEWIQPKPINYTHVEESLIIPKKKIEKDFEKNDDEFTNTAEIEIDTCYLPTQNSQIPNAIFSTQDQILRFENKLQQEKDKFFENMPDDDVDPKILNEYIKKHNKLIKRIEKKINSLSKKKNDRHLIEKTIELQNEFLYDKGELDKTVEQHIKTIENDYLKRQKLMSKWEGLKVSDKVARFMQMRYEDLVNPLSKNNKNR